MKLLASIAIAIAALTAPLVAQASLVTFDSLPADISFGGSMSFHADGHLYANLWQNDDSINFATATTVNSFQMNREPWQGFGNSNPASWNITVEAFGGSNVSLWKQTLNLAAYDQWNEWLTVDVNTAGVHQLTFYATGAFAPVLAEGFWPSIDNLRINEALDSNGVPEPSSLALVGLAVLGLAAVRRRKQG